ncbi:MAG: bifunctional glutamate N-acetyltransferase/amino-acid acetyltransferase ArgJ [Actinobacteria bacterium]|nr:bifunctional glutamate N-acetyltransferase/amino-acid acetyltransferase ArgJ [Actinomycetota bacterium]
MRLVEKEGACPGVTYPLGFVAAGVPAGIKNSGRPDVGILAAEPEFREEVTSAAVFTSNAFAAAPVVVSQRETQLSKMCAVIANSGSANACTGAEGLVVARAMQAACGEVLGVEPDHVGVASTGLIGLLPPTDRIRNGIAMAGRNLTRDGGSSFLSSIMTTDRFPKACALEVETVDGVVRLGGCAKGAGMIAPAMATMLCFVTTDAVVSHGVLRSLLRRVVGKTFNCVSVDGQMSTNDCVFLLAGGASRVFLSPAGAAQLGAALRCLLLRLALMMVADGEGATKVVRLRVRGAANDEDARTVARAVADSSLVKTAMYGCDPNWGRILSAAGAALPRKSLPRVYLEIGGVRVAQEARAVMLTPQAESTLKEVMARSEVDILLHLGNGRSHEKVYFSDLGHEYVAVNSEYST